MFRLTQPLRLTKRTLTSAGNWGQSDQPAPVVIALAPTPDATDRRRSACSPSSACSRSGWDADARCVTGHTSLCVADATGRMSDTRSRRWRLRFTFRHRRQFGLFAATGAPGHASSRLLRCQPYCKAQTHCKISQIISLPNPKQGKKRMLRLRGLKIIDLMPSYADLGRLRPNNQANASARLRGAR